MISTSLIASVALGAAVLAAATYQHWHPESVSQWSVTGSIEPRREPTLSTKGSGRVQRVYVKEGEAVRRGDILVELEHAEINAVIAQARANVTQSKAEVAQSQHALEQAQAEASREQTTLARIDAEVRDAQLLLADATRRYRRDAALSAQNAIASSTVDDRQTEMKCAEVKLEVKRLQRVEAEHAVAAARAKVDALSSGVSMAKLELAREQVQVLETKREESYVVRAPFDGTIGQLFVTEGDYIDATTPRFAICTIADISELYFAASVSPKEAAGIHASQSAEVIVDDDRSTTLSGVVASVLPRRDKDGRSTVLVRVRLDSTSARPHWPATAHYH